MSGATSSGGLQTKEAQAFAARLFAAQPALKEYAPSHSDDREVASSRSVLEMPCPNPNIPDGMMVWMVDGTDPSLTFGRWHTHASLFDGSVDAGWDGLIDYVGAILTDQFVLVREVGTRRDWVQILDLREQDALADLLTSSFCSGTVDLLTWSGLGDRRVSLNDLELAPAR